MQEQNMNIDPLQTEGADADAPNVARIRALNDSFRQSFTGGRVVMTAGVGALSDRVRAEVLAAIRTHSDWNVDNDPHDEHDFGVVDIGPVRAFWKIDYHDRSMRLSSPDAADPAVTVRVLNILLAEEY